MTAHVHDHKEAQDLNNLRLFEPAVTLAATARGVDSPELDAQLGVMFSYLKHTPQPRCFLCESLLGARTPSLMGWGDVKSGKMVFAVCRDCGDIPKAEREQAVLNKLGFKPMAHCGNA